MKKSLLILTAIISMTSCEKAQISTEPTLRTKLTTFKIEGDFKHSYEEMTRAVLLSEDNAAAVTDLYILDYTDGTLTQSIHQYSTDTDFGTPSLNLAYGHHDIKFVASKGTAPVLSTSALSWTKVLDTFSSSLSIDVAASSSNSRTVELKRIVSGVKLHISDKVPAEAKEIHITFDRSQSLALPSLVASATSSLSNMLEIPSSWVGKTGGEITTYTLCPTEEMTTDVDILVLDSSGNSISTFTIPNVSLKQNRITTLTGPVFGRGNGFSISIDNGWDEGLDVTF